MKSKIISLFLLASGLALGQSVRQPINVQKFNDGTNNLTAAFNVPSGVTVHIKSGATLTADSGSTVNLGAGTIPWSSLSGVPTTAATLGLTNGAQIDTWGTKVNPTGIVLGTTDSQTLTNKTINTATNTFEVSGQQFVSLGTNLSITGGVLNASGGGSVAWGAITGTLSAQTDLQNALNLLAPLANPTFTGTVTTPATITIGSATLNAGAGGTLGSNAFTSTVFLVASNNLSDLVTPATARTNLGLGTAAVAAASSFAAVANNLSDLASESAARTNLGLGSAALLASSAVAQTANNLSDLASESTARTNLGLGTAATQATGTFAQVANNLSDLASASTARSNLGLGTAAVKAASGSGSTLASVTGSFTTGDLAVFADTSGTIEDGGLPGAGTVTAVSIATANGFSGSSSGGATPALTIVAGAINPTSIGQSSAGPGSFTTLSASSTVSGTGFSAYLASPPAIGGTTAAAGAFTTLSASSTVSGTGFSTYLASPPAIGGTAPAGGAFTTLSASSTVSGTGFSTYLASPPAIGGTAPAGGAFTTLSASSTVSGTGFSTYLASPPAIGGTSAAAAHFTTIAASGQITSTLSTGTAPFSVTSTTNVANLNASSLNGATFAAPGAIGGGTASAGTFTTISGSSTITFSAMSTAGVLTNNGSGVLASLSNASAVNSTLMGLLGTGWSNSQSLYLAGNGTWSQGVTFGSVTQYAPVYALTTTEFGTIASPGTTTTVLHGNASGAPSYGAVVLTTDVSGLLPVANGGIGVGTLTGLVVGNGTSAMSAVTAPSGTVVGTTDTQTLSAKRITARVNTTASSATPAINTDTTDMFTITALATNITSMTSSLTGTPNNGDQLLIRIIDNGTSRTIAWGTSFESIPGGGTLPTATVISTYLYVLLVWNSTASKWDCVSST